MRTKSLSIVTGGTLLTVALVFGYFSARPIIKGSTLESPIFIGEELIVRKIVSPLILVKTNKAVSLVRSESTPPKIAVPLPIVPPAITFKVLPVYPSTALAKGLSGSVILSVYVGTQGQTEKIETKVASGLAEFDQAAIAAVAQWKFSPATQNGTAISSCFEVPISFQIIE